MIWYRRAIYAFAAFFMGIGVALIIVTAVNGGGALGFLVGGLFVALGAARISLERRRAR